MARSLSHPNGTLSNIDPQTPSPDLLSDLLGPLAIEAPPGAVSYEQHGPVGAEGVPDEVDGSAIVPVEEQTNTVEVIFSYSFTFFGIVGFSIILLLLLAHYFPFFFFTYSHIFFCFVFLYLLLGNGM